MVLKTFNTILKGAQILHSRQIPTAHIGEFLLSFDICWIVKDLLLC